MNEGSALVQPYCKLDSMSQWGGDGWLYKTEASSEVRNKAAARMPQVCEDAILWSYSIISISIENLLHMFPGKSKSQTFKRQSTNNLKMSGGGKKTMKSVSVFIRYLHSFKRGQLSGSHCSFLFLLRWRRKTQTDNIIAACRCQGSNLLSSLS